MPKITLNKKQISIIGLVLLSGISVLYLFSRAQPQEALSEVEQVRQTVVENPKSDLARIKSPQITLADNYVIPDYPAELPIYSFSATPLDILKETQLLAQKMDLKKHPSLNNYWVNNGESQTLYFDANRDEIVFSVFQAPPAEMTIDGPKLNHFVSLAQAYVQNTFIKTFNSLKSEVSYLVGVDELTASPNQQAVRILVPFTTTLDNYSLKSDAKTKAPLTVFVDVNNLISGFEYYPNTITVGNVLKKVSAQTKDKIKYLIMAGAGKVSYVYSDTPIVTTVDSFDKIVLDSAVVEYHSDPLRGQIVPYLNFTGKTTTAEHGDIKLNILLPLVVLD